MPGVGFFNSVMITILFIALSGVVAAFIRGRKRDKCLKDFEGFLVTLEDASGKSIWGNLRVEAKGIELLYQQVHQDPARLAQIRRCGHSRGPSR